MTRERQPAWDTLFDALLSDVPLLARRVTDAMRCELPAASDREATHQEAR